MGDLTQFGADEPGKTQRLGVYGICVEDDRILMVRASNLTEVPGRWFLPGGGVDHGEHPEESLAREFREETGLSVHVGRFLGVLSDVRKRANGAMHHTIRLIYSVDYFDGVLKSELIGSSDLAQWIEIHRASEYEIAVYAQRAAALAGISLQSVK
jgi:8-oxo-dGTP diphosphatase